MEHELLSAAVVLAGLTGAWVGLIIAAIALILGFAALAFFWWRETSRPLFLARVRENPILAPMSDHWWESEAVFNPAAIVDDGRVHLFYRAMGPDGVSRIGYASSKDGIHFDERLPYPVLEPRGRAGFGMPTEQQANTPGKLSYNTITNPSGGGWAGFEDPRSVKMNGRVYLSFTAFDGWGFVRMAFTSTAIEHFRNKLWQWRNPALMSPQGQVHKNWVLFPEKIGGKFAVLHSLAPKVSIEYVDDLEEFHNEERSIQSNYQRDKGRKNHWDKWVRGAGPPPLRTPWGWLLFYHGFDPARHDVGYKVGAMLLDLDDPEVVLARSDTPVLEPAEWYEHDWKPNVVIATGAVVLGDDLIVYYGGGDKRIAAAKANLAEFIRRLRGGENAHLEPVV